MFPPTCTGWIYDAIRIKPIPTNLSVRSDVTVGSFDAEKDSSHGDVLGDIDTVTALLKDGTVVV